MNIFQIVQEIDKRKKQAIGLLPQRVQDNLNALTQQSQARGNLNQQLATSIKQKQAGQTFQPNPYLGTTSAPFSSLDKQEQQFIDPQNDNFDELAEEAEYLWNNAR